MSDRSTAEPTGPVTLRVTRTGGIAGVRREWLAAPPAAEAPHWVELIERCEWQGTPAARTGTDRFVWDIRAHCGSEVLAVELPDAGLTGAWRDLVDAVRDYARTSPPNRPDHRG